MLDSLNNREKTYLIIIGILLIGFLLQTLASQQTIKEYTDAYNECLYAYNMAERGVMPLINGVGFYENITISTEFIE